ncbi:MAG: putative 2-dehydropantoate 2-reductase [Fibrobacterales bacterium]
MPSLTYAVIGTGAVGGYYGGKLAHAGFDVHFLLHSDYKEVVSQGLRVDSIDGDMHILPAQCYDSFDALPKVDVLLVALKATQNYLLKEILPRLYHPEQTIVLMQNGLGGEEEIAQYIPRAHIMGGLCFICSNKIGPGHIHHLDYGGVMLGEYYTTSPLSEPSNRFLAIVENFKSASIEVTASDDLRLARWKKLVWNMPFNGLSVLFGDTRTMMDTAESRKWAESIMHETVAAAGSQDVFIEPTFIDTMISQTDVMKPYKPSMMLDYQNGRAMELDFIYKYPINKGLEKGVVMGRTQALYLQLLELDKKNRTN